MSANRILGAASMAGGTFLVILAGNPAWSAALAIASIFVGCEAAIFGVFVMLVGMSLRESALLLGSITGTTAFLAFGALAVYTYVPTSMYVVVAASYTGIAMGGVGCAVLAIHLAMRPTPGDG